jgi:hypothetical protein
VKDITPRGPYKSHTAGMTQREAAEWFAKEAVGRGNAITPESAYLNAGTPSCVDHERVHEEKRRSRDGEYYKQAGFAGLPARLK